LLDSGALRHMSSYHDLFQDFVNIMLKHITTTDKHTFKATGKGNIMITLPNASQACEYSSKMSYMHRRWA
ncbi:uncharacterized protein BJ212DRAFT_1267786, partial [Suillus subaureus]